MFGNNTTYLVGELLSHAGWLGRVQASKEPLKIKLIHKKKYSFSINKK